jgi:hypothetical protein
LPPVFLVDPVHGDQLIFEVISEGPSFFVKAWPISLTIQVAHLRQEGSFAISPLLSQVSSPAFQELAGVARCALPKVDATPVRTQI